MNPLFARELRARWRDRRAWWLVLALTIALGFLAHAMFLNGVSRADETVPVRLPNGQYTYRTLQSTPSARAARAGRELFMAMALGNVAAWLLVAPILTATPIARERERGLLESLQLSHMTPRSQIAARVGAALIFLLLLQLAVAPIYAIIFWLGGVSPGEFALAGAVISLTALGGISVGTWISARSHRPSSALFTVLGFVILWTLALYPGAILAFGAATGANPLWSVLGTAIVWSHPLPLIWAVTDTTGETARVLPSPLGWEREQFVLAVCALWSALSLISLALATRAVKRPLPPASFEARASKPVRSWRSSVARRQNNAQINAPNTLPTTAATAGGITGGRRIENALIADVPIEKWMRFKNPLLEREVRARFRLRRGGLALMLGRLLLLLAGVWRCGLRDLLAHRHRESHRCADRAHLFSVDRGRARGRRVGVVGLCARARKRHLGSAQTVAVAPTRNRARQMAVAVVGVFYLLAAASGSSCRLAPITTARTSVWTRAPWRYRLASSMLSLGTISMAALLVSWRAKQPNTALGWVLGLGLGLFIAIPILREATEADMKITRALYGVNVRATPYFRATTSEQQRAVNFPVSDFVLASDHRAHLRSRRGHKRPGTARTACGAGSPTGGFRVSRRWRRAVAQTRHRARPRCQRGLIECAQFPRLLRFDSLIRTRRDAWQCVLIKDAVVFVGSQDALPCVPTTRL